MHGMKMCIIIVLNGQKLKKKHFLSYIQYPTQCKLLISLSSSRNVILKEVLDLSL